MTKRSRAGRTGRTWYGSYDFRYADPTAEGGARYVGGMTNKERAIRSARQMVERGETAWAEVLTDRSREGGGQVIARFERGSTARKTSPAQLDREIAEALANEK